MIDVINYHITSTCNYHCQYCFVGFQERTPAKETAFKVVEKIHKFFIKSGITGGRINIAGGEPLLYPYLTDVINQANTLGLKVSVITNGSLLTEELISNWHGKVEMLGISIDAVTDETNCAIGREYKGKSLSIAQLCDIAYWIHKHGIKLKINTVVSKLNVHDNLLPLYKKMKPNRLKFLCMHVLENINSEVNELKPTREQFETFVAANRYEHAEEFVAEAEGSMQNSYLMISPSGNVFLNENGEGKIFGNCLEQDLYEICGMLPFDNEKYNLRYYMTGKGYEKSNTW